MLLPPALLLVWFELDDGFISFPKSEKSINPFSSFDSHFTYIIIQLHSLIGCSAHSKTKLFLYSPGFGLAVSYTGFAALAG